MDIPEPVSLANEENVAIAVCGCLTFRAKTENGRLDSAHQQNAHSPPLFLFLQSFYNTNN